MDVGDLIISHCLYAIYGGSTWGGLGGKLLMEPSNQQGEIGSDFQPYSRAEHIFKGIHTTLPTRKSVVAISAGYAILVMFFALFLRSPLYWGRSYLVYNPPFLVAAFALVICTVPALWMPTTIRRPSQLLYWALYTLVFIPGIVMMHLLFVDIRTGLPMTLALISGMAIIGASYHLPLVSITLPRVNERIAILTLWALTAVLAITVHFTVGFEIRTVSLATVHDARAVWHADINALPRLTGRIATYAMMWLKNIVFPALLAVGLISRNGWRIGAGLSGMALVYVTGGWRSAIFITGTVIGIGIICSRTRDRERFPVIMLISLIIGLLVSMALTVFAGQIAPASIARRLVLAQGAHVPRYFEFFADPTNPFVYLSDRPFVPWIEYPYAGRGDVADVIGAEYYDSVGNIHANASSWTDGYAMFGLPGVAFFSVCLAIYFWVYDSLTQKVDIRLACMLAGATIIPIVNTAFVTALFTHGLGLLLIIAAILGAGFTSS